MTPHFSVCQTHLHISCVSTGIILYVVAEKHKFRVSVQSYLHLLEYTPFHILSVVPEHSRQSVKMVYPYLATNTVPALEVSTHSGWPVLITVLIIQASYTIALACGLRVAHLWLQF